MPLSSRFVGRTAELDALDAALTALEGGTPRAVEVVGPAGIGRAGCSRAGRPSRCSGSRRPQRLGRRARAGSPLLGVRRRAGRLRRGSRPARLERLDPATRSELGNSSPPSRTRQPRLRQRFTSATGRTVPLECCSNTSRSQAARAAPRRLPLGRSGLDRSAQRAPSPSARGGRADRARPQGPQLPARLATALEARTAPGARSGRTAAADTGRDARTGRRARRALLRGDRRQPVLSRAAGSGSNRHASEGRGRGGVARRRAGAADGGRVRLPRSCRCSPPVRRVLDGASVAGDPFEVELAAAAADLPETRCWTAIDELARLSSSGKPTCRGGSGSGTRSSAGRYTRHPRRLADRRA